MSHELLGFGDQPVLHLQSHDRDSRHVFLVKHGDQADVALLGIGEIVDVFSASGSGGPQRLPDFQRHVVLRVLHTRRERRL